MAGGTANTALLIWGGFQYPKCNKQKRWNGSAWTESYRCKYRKEMVIYGSRNIYCSISAGGIIPPATNVDCENWDGTSWTE